MTAKIDFASWPDKWYGFWHTIPQDHPSVPLFQAGLDPTWHPEDHERLVSYLATAPVVLSGGIVFLEASVRYTPQHCPWCNEIIDVNVLFRSDGEWMWTQFLAHHVARHDVRLPDALVEHIRKQNYVPPAEVTTPLERLPHPPPLTAPLPRPVLPKPDTRSWSVEVLSAEKPLQVAKVVRDILGLSFVDARARVATLPAVVFTGDVATAKAMAERLASEGIRHECRPVE